MDFSRFLYTRLSRKQLVRLFPVALVISAMALGGSASAINDSQVPQEAGARHIKIRRPSDHPIAVKQIRNLQGPHFLRGVEIDIQNVSNKPVYYVCLYFRFPDVEVTPNVHYAFSLYYGDTRFDRVGQYTSPWDLPIPPGGTYTFKVPDVLWQGFEWYETEKNLPPALTNNLELWVEETSFGDGTGYDNDEPYPRRRKSF